MQKTKNIQKEELTVISNIEYLQSLSKEQRTEIYKKMLGIPKNLSKIQNTNS